MELENRAADQKKELFSIRDKKNDLQQELDSLKTALSLTGHPASQLLQLIQTRDLSIIQLKEKIQQLELNVKHFTESNQQLQEKFSKMQDKFHQGVKNPVTCIYKRYTAPSQPSSSRTYVSERASQNVSFLGDSQSQLQYSRSSDSQILVQPPPPPNSVRVSDSSSSSFVHIKKPLSFTKLCST